MPEPKTDRSAMGLLSRLMNRLSTMAMLQQAFDAEGSVSRLHASLAPKFPLAVLHARNVDKQRRRLLALKCSHKARTCDASAIAAQEGDSPYADWCRRHAAKLRAIAARLRGTK